jgi:hypothetical protein
VTNGDTSICPCGDCVREVTDGVAEAPVINVGFETGLTDDLLDSVSDMVRTSTAGLGVGRFGATMIVV